MDQINSFEVRLDNITKAYPGVIALDQVSLSLKGGEVVGLLGENGAGKSTLMKVLGGVTTPTKGEITIDGVAYAELSVRQSQEAGIAFVHQELNDFDNLDVASNIFLGRETRSGPFGLVDQAAMNRAVEPFLKRVGASFGPRTAVADLSLAERQLLEIAKALSTNARLIIMDEPTSSLTLSETNTLLKVIADLKRDGVCVVFISHRLSEVEQAVDRVVVLKDGTVAGHLSKGEINHDAMIRMMIGRDLKSLYLEPKRAPGEEILSFRDARTGAFPAAGASFEVRAGEIVGMAGLVGSGRTELATAAFGIDSLSGGEVWLSGKPLIAQSPTESIAQGFYLVPEDRKAAGLILEFSITENVTMASLPDYATRGIVDAGKQAAVAEQQRQKLAIKTPDVRRYAVEMSGGNQQKVVLAKWLSMAPKAIIFDEPTRGIDVGAKTEIYRLMRELADAGVAIVMISSDMEEVIGVSDRIVVMREGAVAGHLARRDFSEKNVLDLAVGKQKNGTN